MIFPFLELIFFVGSALMLNYSIIISAFLLLISGVWLSFSVHIFFHECVHRNERYSSLFNWVATILMGLPFDGYRIHHFNHHRYENGSCDFSTTWKWQGSNKIPRPLLSYALGWPRQLIAGMGCENPFGGSRSDAERIKQRIPAQKKALLFSIIVLAVLSWKILLLYLALIYLGWALSSVHNYGQHPPIEGNLITTFTNELYNKIFFNNGLHWEHHHAPSLRWNELLPEANSYRIQHSHLISPLVREGYNGRQ